MIVARGFPKYDACRKQRPDTRMVHTLFDHIDRYGPTAFEAEVLAKQPDLFVQRAALFFTPTDFIPSEWIGSRHLDIWLPIAPPDIASQAFERTGVPWRHRSIRRVG